MGAARETSDRDSSLQEPLDEPPADEACATEDYDFTVSYRRCAPILRSSPRVTGELCREALTPGEHFSCVSGARRELGTSSYSIVEALN